MAKFKSKFTWIGALALAAALLGARASVAAPVVPPDSIAPDTIAVIHVNAVHFNPETMRTAAQTILGQNAAKADEPINKFKEKFEKATAAGVDSLTLVMGAEKKPEGADANAGKKTSAAVYIHTKAGADTKAIEAAFTSDMPPEEKAKTVFEIRGEFLVAFQKDQPLPTKFDADRAKAFADALGTISEMSFQLAFIPDAAMKEQMVKESVNETPIKGLKDAGPLLANSKWMTVAINFGNAPGISLSAKLADEGDTKKLSDSINTALDDLKAQVANPNGAPQLAMFAPLIGPLIEGLRPATTGTQVTVALKGASLTSIANFAAQLGVLGK